MTVSYRFAVLLIFFGVLFCPFAFRLVPLLPESVATSSAPVSPVLASDPGELLEPREFWDWDEGLSSALNPWTSSAMLFGVFFLPAKIDQLHWFFSGFVSFGNSLNLALRDQLNHKTLQVTCYYVDKR